MALAASFHRGDVRKGTTIPYVSHLLQMSGLVLEYGGDEDEAIAGLLHDAAEDAGGEAALAQIASRFGDAVAGIVRENSDSISEAKADKAPWRERKEAYLAAIPHKTESACLVSIADKVHNARSLLADCRLVGDAHWSRFNCTRDESLWYYRALVDAFLAAADRLPRLRRGAEELAVAVSELETEATKGDG